MNDVLPVGAPMRAKFRIQSVTNNGYSDIVKFGAVYGGSSNPEDNSFSKATPNATCEMTIDNPDLRGKYVPGQVFYVDFTPVMEK